MAASATSASTVSQNQFLQLYVKQLQSQDPTSPTDTGQSLTQLAQFSSLSYMEKLNTSFSEMLSLQEVTQGSSLIGKTVSYKNADGAKVSGTVKSVGITDGHVGLSIGNDTVSLNQVVGVGS